MKIIVSKKALSAALQHCCAAATKNSTMPILKCVLLVPGTGGFRLRAANEGVKMAVSCLVEAKVTSPEALCIPAHDLLDRVKALPDGDIEIVSKDGRVTLKVGARKLSLSTLAPEDYPKLSDPEGQVVVLSAKTLAAAIRSTLFAVNDDPASASTHSLKVALLAGILTLGATDGHRISEWSARVDAEGAFEALIPKASALLLRSVLDSADGAAQICLAEPTFYVTIGSVTFAAVTSSVQFPPIDRVFPEKRSTVEVMPSVAVDSLKALSIVAGRLGNVRIAASGGKMRAAVDSAENGESSDEFQAVGDSFEAVKSNAGYLIDAFASLGSETATLDCGAPTDPIVIKGGNVRACVMPIIN